MKTVLDGYLMQRNVVWRGIELNPFWRMVLGSMTVFGGYLIASRMELTR